MAITGIFVPLVLLAVVLAVALVLVLRLGVRDRRRDGRDRPDGGDRDHRPNG